MYCSLWRLTAACLAATGLTLGLVATTASAATRTAETATGTSAPGTSAPGGAAVARPPPTAQALLSGCR
jgi:hypothetical protein